MIVNPPRHRIGCGGGDWKVGSQQAESHLAGTDGNKRNCTLDSAAKKGKWFRCDEANKTTDNKG